MPQMPTITVQLVHIQGPLKGQVSEFSQFPVHIGRHSSCQIRFGKELKAISRQHARIECKGNRFRIIDVSTNGTYINGKRIANVYLRDGDVITFSENGPKASFLTKIGAGSTVMPLSQPRTILSDPSSQPADSSSPIPPEPMLTLGADKKLEVLSTNAPLEIQSGEALQSYNILPVTIGNDPACDFIIADQGLNGRHAQIFFSKNNYYAKDLTEKGVVKINGRPIETQSVLAQGAELSLTEHGPRFRFLGDGRLAEIKEMVPEKLEKTKIAPKSDRLEKQPSIRQKISRTLFNGLFKKG